VKRIMFSGVNKNWINNYPKYINENGCWIPTEHRAGTQGYVTIKIYYAEYKLHRLVVAVYYNLDYHDQSWDARHGKNCDKACFNPEHLQPGTISDNQRDSVEHGTHWEAKKTHCAQGHPFDDENTHIDSRGKRHCRACDNERQKLRRQVFSEHVKSLQRKRYAKLKGRKLWEKMMREQHKK
jgi:hypothetical protein